MLLEVKGRSVRPTARKIQDERKKEEHDQGLPTLLLYKPRAVRVCTADCLNARLPVRKARFDIRRLSRERPPACYVAASAAKRAFMPDRDENVRSAFRCN